MEGEAAAAAAAAAVKFLVPLKGGGGEETRPSRKQKGRVFPLLWYIHCRSFRGSIRLREGLNDMRIGWGGRGFQRRQA